MHESLVTIDEHYAGIHFRTVGVQKNNENILYEIHVVGSFKDLKTIIL